jgi:hypothetical protein
MIIRYAYGLEDPRIQLSSDCLSLTRGACLSIGPLGKDTP